MTFEHFIINGKLDEASYEGNIGFEEMVKFYQIADNDEINKIEDIIKKNDWDNFKRIIKKVIGVNLK